MGSAAGLPGVERASLGSAAATFRVDTAPQPTQGAHTAAIEREVVPCWAAVMRRLGGGSYRPQPGAQGHGVDGGCVIRLGGQLSAAVRVFGLLSAGCAVESSEPEPVAEVDDDEGSDDPAADGGLEPTEDEVTPLEDPAVQDAILLTAVDEVLAGTVYAGAVDEDPGAFLLTAASLCEALDDGAEPDAVLGGLLATLREAGLDLDDDTAYLAGGLYGAAVEVRCPQHAGSLETSP